MRDHVRSYGDIHGFSAQAFAMLKDSIPYPQVRYDAEKRILHVDHEGEFIWIDDFLEQVCALMDEDGWGEVDFIDHQDLILTRHSLRFKQHSSIERPFDQVGTLEMRLL